MKSLTFFIFILLCVTISAQSPQKMSYQCVVRNSSGALVVNQAVGMKISILRGSATGTVVFSETFSPNPQTNANGLVTVEIGGGTATVGTFVAIDWAAGPYFLKTETDPAGGTSYTITGTSQLLSVPYAMYAKTAANGFSGAWADLTGKPAFATVATSGSYADLLNRPSLFSGSYNDLTNKPVLFDGTWTSLTGKPAGFTDGIDNVDDADNSITNEIQALSLSGTVLSLSSGGGSVTLPSSGGGDNWGTQTVVTNTTLTGLGTTASPLAVANTVITPSWSRIQGIPAGFADGTDNFDDADNSITNEIQTLNLSGTTLTLSSGGGSVTLPSSGGGDNWGTQTVVTDATLAGNGTTATPLRIADNGVSTAKIVNSAITADKLATNAVTTDKINAGAVTGAKIAQAGATAGQALKWNGTTWAPAQDETGGSGFALPYEGSASSAGSVFEIINNATSGNTAGIKGESASTQGYGIYGRASALAGYNWGVYGISTSLYGTGVEGRSTSATGVSWGVKGKAFSPEGVGVYGSGASFGVYGESAGNAGMGVMGIATSETGITFGVYGKAISGIGVFGTSETVGVSGTCTSSDGYGVYGESSKYGTYGKSTGGTGRAVLGEATGTASIGVMGIATNTSSTGVWGEGANQGVYGTSPSATGKGIYGAVSSATAFSGYFEGGKFYTNSNTGIKTTDPTQSLDVNGNARIRSIGSGAYAGVVNRTSDGTLTTATSDGRLKENVNTLSNSLEKVMQLNGVTFTWKSNPEYGTRIGFIAQEFEKVIPELVFTNDVDGYKGINYAEVSAVLVEAMKEQQQQIEDQQKEIDELKALVNSLVITK